mmetsp:Transcript_76301/g.227403  ORF Transcript_76301/g.227403 Transcript_76301/m.227403 type:complete len:153 (+) Transcript_76301:2-460(+)
MLAVDDGWLNARKRLKLVEDKIRKAMEDLSASGQKLPEMHCEKHFEEWHDPPPTPAPIAIKAGVERDGATVGESGSSGSSAGEGREPEAPAEEPPDSSAPATAEPQGRDAAESAPADAELEGSSASGWQLTLCIFLAFFALGIICAAVQAVR